MSNPIIVHSIPVNKDVCGGIKVHYQLAMLERELGYDSFIVYNDNDAPSVKWFKHTCTEYTLQHFKYYLEEQKQEVFLLIGWEEPSSLDILEAQHKAVYVQGHVFFRGKDAYKDAKLWFNSNYVKISCNAPGVVISPYLPSYFIQYKLPIWQYFKHRHKLLIQERKQGKGAWEKVVQHLPALILDKLEVTILKDVDEITFRDALRNTDIFFAHSFPEGFGLPPLEAMGLGALVIGYTGGGGSDFMRNNNNCFISPDGDSTGVAKHLMNILSPKYNNIQSVLSNAYDTALSYSKVSTKELLSTVLEGYKNGS